MDPTPPAGLVDHDRALLLDRLPEHPLSVSEREAFQRAQRLCLVDPSEEDVKPRGWHRAVLGDVHMRPGQVRTPRKAVRWCLRCGAVHQEGSRG